MMKIGMKLAMMLGLIVLMSIALSLVSALISERKERSDQVREEVSQLSAGEQTLSGPFLVLPYTRTTSKFVEEDKEKSRASHWEEQQSIEDAIILAPSQFDASGQLAVEVLKRGLFEAPIYRSNVQLSGRFMIPPLVQYETTSDSNRERISIRWKTPYLALNISDVRGIQDISSVTAAQTLKFFPGIHQYTKLKSNVEALVNLPVQEANSASNRPVDFNLKLNLTGSKQFLIEPIGDSSKIALSGNWPHPSFTGNFAPSERNVTSDSFNARWQTSELATGGNKTIRCKEGEACEAVYVGLRLLDPVDRYVLNERTMKYSGLFMVLIFGTVFLMEIVHKLAVHPVQYALVGLGLAVFFLLTLALSEHIGFNKAYGIAALASTGLQGYYVSFVLGGWRRGLGFAAVLGALYGILFAILHSENMALLMGSLTIFGLLACAMYLTRNIDWAASNVRASTTASTD